MGISTITVTDSDRISVPSRNYKEVFLLDFDYITLNNIDEETKGRMGKDVSETGYKGSKSAYVAGLIRDGLDKRESLKTVSDKKEVEKLGEGISSLKESLVSLTKLYCQGIPKGEIDRLLLIECFWMLAIIMESSGLSTEDIMDGRYDMLPFHLESKESALRRADEEVA